MKEGSDQAPEDWAEAVWVAHGMIMQGGVLHCVEALSPPELDRATLGYRLIGLAPIAELLTEARALPATGRELAEARLDRGYASAVADDEFLEAALNRAIPLAAIAEARTEDPRGPIEKAITQFIEWSVKSETLSKIPGKTREQHRAFFRSESAIKELLAHWESGGHRALLGLLDHPDDVVRVSAAAYLCESDPDRSIPVLEALERAGSSASMTAYGVLFALKRGRHQPLTRLREADGPSAT